MIKFLLLPFSLLYRIIVSVRNKLFDWQILKSQSFKLPIICIGNITVGGTGKTPHTEMLINLLKEKYNIAVLSRGYKRKTDNFIEVQTSSTVNDVGDEPLQIKKKFPNITVAVDKKRVNGVQKLLTNNNPDVILLDDAFQHRHIKAGLNILLIDYNKPIHKDFILPTGRLREPAKNKNRADIIIITKCPAQLNQADFNKWTNELKIKPTQKLFFTTLKYKQLVNLFNTEELTELSNFKEYTALVVTAIANPTPIYEKLKSANINIEKAIFTDHHTFSETDLQKINKQFDSISNSKKVIICTEKDSVKLKELTQLNNKYNRLPIYYLPIVVDFLNNKYNRLPIYYLPIVVDFLNNCKQEFTQEIEKFIKA